MSTWGKVFPGRRYNKCKSLEPGVVIVLSPSRVQLFATPGTAGHQASLSSTICWSLFRLMSIEPMMPPTIPSCHPFSFFLQSCPASGSFPMKRLFVSGGQSIGASASVLQMISSIKSFRVDFLIEESIIYMRDPSHLRRKMSLGKTNLERLTFLALGRHAWDPPKLTWNETMLYSSLWCRSSPACSFKVNSLLDTNSAVCFGDLLARSTS